jgi:ABC-type uncharacterized transport system substrate-binding protein
MGASSPPRFGVFHYATSSPHQCSASTGLGIVAENRLPAIFSGPEIAEAGGLMSYSADYSEVFRRAALFAHKILNGTKPADLPVEQPTKFEFIINLKRRSSSV